MQNLDNRPFEENVLLSNLTKAKHILGNINWDFPQKAAPLPNNLMPFNCRKYHWFPSTFIPEIPFTLIEVLTLPGAVVYDPFSGIGTTYFQALILNRVPLATENCAVAIEYMRSLNLLFNPNIKYDIIRIIIMEILSSFDPRIDYTCLVEKNIINNMSPWFSAKTLNELSFLYIKQQQCVDEVIKAILRIGISSSLKKACSQNRGWGCIADNVFPKDSQIVDKDVFGIFINIVNILINDLSKFLKYSEKTYNKQYRTISGEESIFRADVRKPCQIADESVDLLITSPPYPNMTDYVTSQRLSYYFMGLSMKEDLGSEIGARIKRFKKNCLPIYLADMLEANKNISKKIKPGGYACYVMPIFNRDNKNNTARRHINQEILKDLENYNLHPEAEYERMIPSKRRSHNIKWTTLEREKIHLFVKD